MVAGWSTPRALAGGAAAALVGASAGFGVARWFGPAGSVLSFGQAVVVGLVTLGVFGAVALLLDRGDLRRLLRETATERGVRENRPRPGDEHRRYRPARPL